MRRLGANALAERQLDTNLFFSHPLLPSLFHGEDGTAVPFFSKTFPQGEVLEKNNFLQSRVYLKTPNTPGQRVFSRCAAPFFLEIRQYSCGKMSCSAPKFLAAGHIESFQIHPT